MNGSGTVTVAYARQVDQTRVAENQFICAALIEPEPAIYVI